MSVITLLLPDFSLILLGCLLLRQPGLSASFWSGIEKLVYYYLFPALLFYSSARLNFQFSSIWKFLSCAVLASGAAILLAYLGGRFCANPDRSFESGLQTAFRFNAYIGLALAASLGAEAASSLMALLIGFMVPLCNLVAVYSLSHQRGNLLSELRKNPLILSTIAGLVCSMLALPIPTSVNLVLQRLGNASLALGLIAVGAGLRFTALPKAKALAATFLLIKLIFLPACGLLLARYLDLPLLQQQVLLLFCALPTASSAYILATRMDGNGPYVAFLISASTLLSVVTLPFWLGLSFSR